MSSISALLRNCYPEHTPINDFSYGDFDVFAKILKALPTAEYMLVRNGVLQTQIEDVVVTAKLPSVFSELEFCIENDQQAMRSFRYLAGDGSVALVELPGECLFTNGQAEVRLPLVLQTERLIVPLQETEEVLVSHVFPPAIVKVIRPYVKADYVDLAVQGEDLLCVSSGGANVQRYILNKNCYADIKARSFTAVYRVFGLHLGKGSELTLLLMQKDGQVVCKAEWKFAEGVMLTTYEHALELPESNW